MIPIRIRFFAVLRELTGYDLLNAEFREGARCEQVLLFLNNEFPFADVLQQSRFAVNGEFAKAETVLRAGDEFAILPPVSGG